MCHSLFQRPKASRPTFTSKKKLFSAHDPNLPDISLEDRRCSAKAQAKSRARKKITTKKKTKCYRRLNIHSLMNDYRGILGFFLSTAKTP